MPQDGHAHSFPRGQGSWGQQPAVVGRQLPVDSSGHGANIDTAAMVKVDNLLQEMKQNPKGVRFADAVKVATHFFGAPRQNGTSHCVRKAPWAGDPRVNLQQGKGGYAKAYQVKQLLHAIEKLDQTKLASGPDK